MKRLLLSLFLLSITGYMPAKGNYSPLLQVYGIEAADHTGSEEAYLKDIYGHSIKYTLVPSPQYPLDIGQNASQNKLDTVLKNTNKAGIIHASCGGSATALNYLAYGEKKDLITGLVLETPIASVNHSIAYRASNSIENPLMGTSSIGTWFAGIIADGAKTEFGRKAYPYALMLFGYVPFRDQPILSIPNIQNKELPIVLVYNPADLSVCHINTLAIYYALKEHGHKHVYLIEANKKTEADHVNLITASTPEAKAIKSIMQYGSHSTRIKTSYYPDHQQFRELYTNLLEYEKQFMW